MWRLREKQQTLNVTAKSTRDYAPFTKKARPALPCFRKTVRKCTSASDAAHTVTLLISLWRRRGAHLGMPAISCQAAKQHDPYEGWHPKPIPEDAPPLVARKKTPTIYNPKRWEDENKRSFQADADDVYPFTLNGSPYSYVVRSVFDKAKAHFQVMWCRNETLGVEGWTLYNFPEPRPMMNLEDVINNPKKPVLVVEGEKCAKAGQQFMPWFNVVTWAGGTNATLMTDWTPLKGKRVVLMPDNDDPGIAAMEELADNLYSVAGSIETIPTDAARPKGWDIADAAQDMEPKEFIEWAKHRKVPYDETPPDDAPVEDNAPETQNDSPQEPDTMPIRAIGYDHNNFYYMVKSSQQIVSLTPSAHQKKQLLSFANTDYWEREFGMGKDGEKVYDYASQAMMNACYKAGIFDEDKIRGRGAWKEEGKSIIPTGDYVYVNGEPKTPVQASNEKFVYEKANSLGIQPDVPATDEEANRLADICNRVTWEYNLSASLLAGWCVIAPVCGALQWRPHIFITGGAGTGKSTVMKHIIGKVLGKLAIRVAGGTTEAAIRQQLRHDARPILFDEAEPAATWQRF